MGVTISRCAHLGMRVTGLGMVTSSKVVQALAPLLVAGRKERIDQVAASRLGGLAVVLEDLRDPHNAGAALRSCEAMGVPQVHVISMAQRFRTAARVTQGCEKWLDLRRWTNSEDCLKAVRDAGFRIYAAVPEADLCAAEIDVSGPVALAFGNEHLGLSPRLRALAEGEFRIPMYGFSRSLNVSVSVAIALHVVSESRRRPIGRPGDLDDESRLELTGRYYALDVRGASAIIAKLTPAEGGQ